MCIGPQETDPVLVGERDDVQDQLSAPLPNGPFRRYVSPVVCARCRSIALRVRCHVRTPVRIKAAQKATLTAAVAVG